MTMKLEVFVSHLTVESKFADLLRSSLTTDFIGLVSFFVSTDATSIPVGSQWFGNIIAALNRADLLLVICSRESVRRQWIQYEAGGAGVRGIDVIPLCHSGIAVEQLPVPLSMSEGALLTSAKGLEKLYAKISAMLGSAVPSADFEALARAFKALEEEYSVQRNQDDVASRERSDEIIVKNPHVLCVSSQQYLKLGFDNQLQRVLDAFPPDLRHERVITSTDVQRVLRAGRVDIVHIAAYVCPRTGVLYFSPVELPFGTAAEGDVDFIRPAALAMLLRDAETRLVVIASGDSLALATTLLSVTNVIAPRDIVSAQAMAAWVNAFYTTLRGAKPLIEACEFAGLTSQAPMRLLTQQMPSAMKMTFSDGVEPSA
jgi:TIR domain